MHNKSKYVLHYKIFKPKRLIIQAIRIRQKLLMPMIANPSSFIHSFFVPFTITKFLNESGLARSE